MCTAGKQGSASRRSLTRQHKVSSRREYRSPKDDCGILSWVRQSVVRPFCNRTVNSASFRNVLAYISPYGVLCPFFHFSHPPVLFSPHLPPPYSISEARLFSLQSSIVGCQPCQVPLALAAGKSLLNKHRNRHYVMAALFVILCPECQTVLFYMYRQSVILLF